MYLDRREERTKSALKTDWCSQLLKMLLKIVLEGRMNVSIAEMIHRVGSSQFEMKVKEIIVEYIQVPSVDRQPFYCSISQMTIYNQ